MPTSLRLTRDDGLATDVLLDALFNAETAPRFDPKVTIDLANELLASEQCSALATDHVTGGGAATSEDLAKSGGRSDRQPGSGFGGSGLLLKAQAEAKVAALSEVGRAGAISGHRWFVEAGYNYLAAVSDGDPAAVVDGRKLQYERALLREPSIKSLSAALFAEVATQELEKIAGTYDIPMDAAYRARRPDPDDRSSGMPLTRDEVRALLVAASATQDGVKAAMIQLRLAYAIPGMTEPPPTTGPVAARFAKLSRVFVKGFNEGSLVSRTEQVVKLLDAR